MGFLIRLPRAASYLDENLISTHLWDRLSNAILKASFTSLIQFSIPPDDDDLEIAAYHLYKFMVRLHPGAFLINPEDQEAVANFVQYFAVHVDQYEIYVFTPPSEGIAHRISAVLRGSLMPPPIVMDSYSRYPNADTEGFWARLHQGTWRLVDGFNAEFCIDSPPVGPLGNLEGQDLVVNVAQGFDMLAEGENRRVLDKYVYGTPVAAVCQIYTDDQAVSPGNLEGQDPVVLRGSLMPPPIATLFGGTPASDPRGMRPSRQPLGRETRSDGKIISDGQPAFAKHRITPQDYLDAFEKYRVKPQDYLKALARVF